MTREQMIDEAVRRATCKEDRAYFARRGNEGIAIICAANAIRAEFRRIVSEAA